MTARVRVSSPVRRAPPRANVSRKLDLRGLRRVRRGRGFAYVTSTGKPLRATHEVQRIASLKIPPAWSDVRIAPEAGGHLQAIGTDARGRRQYLYHESFRARRDNAKYGRLSAFTHALPAIRRRVQKDLRLRGLTRDKVLAAVVRLLDLTYARIGNDAYTRSNGSFGLTTLRNRHARVRGETISLDFLGKSRVQQQIEVDDRHVAAIIKRCLKLPGRDLLVYLDEQSEVRDITAQQVNAYLQQISGQDFSAKDFRTWSGTVLALRALKAQPAPASPTQAKRLITAAVGEVSEALRNTKAVCRRSYIHPVVLQAFEAGKLGHKARAPQRGVRGLSSEEASVLMLLEGRAHRKSTTSQKAR